MISKKLIFLTGTLCCLCGCSSSPPPTPPAAAPMSPAVIQNQIAQIKTDGVNIVQQGDRLIIIISTDLYFDPLTTRVKPQRQKNLQHIAQFTQRFAQQYPRAIIRVTGYTDTVYGSRQQLEVSQSYADAVASYLFDTGIESKRLSIQGRGSQDPIAGESAPSSMALNRRVVIQIN